MRRRSPGPTLETAGIVLAVFLVQVVVITLGASIELFALSTPLADKPWTIVTSIYAHAGPTHLLANLVALAVFGFIVERRSARWRFHAFVITTGAIAGIVEVLVASLAGGSPFVVGISGAVFALMGYVLASNPVTDSVVAWLEVDARIQVLLMLVLAVALTWVTRGERVALVAHFTGFILGLVSGRAHLLRVP